MHFESPPCNSQHGLTKLAAIASLAVVSLFESQVLPEIRTLDPLRDHQRIAFLTARVDFPWDTTRALEFALFRTFAIPSIGALLQRTGEFEKRAQKRYDDTDIIMSEIMEHGYDSERGRAAIKRMNAMHGRFQISNDDFLYVLSTFVFVPIRWIERFGWRQMIEAERLAWFHFWREVGRRMNIHDIPSEYAAFEDFSNLYEASHFCFSEATQRVGTATRELFKSWFPRILGPLVERSIHAFLDDALIEAFGFPKPSPWLKTASEQSLRARGLLLRVWPRRRTPLLRTEMPHRSYPEGYDIDKVGPPPA